MLINTLSELIKRQLLIPSKHGILFRIVSDISYQLKRGRNFYSIDKTLFKIIIWVINECDKQASFELLIRAESF